MDKLELAANPVTGHKSPGGIILAGSALGVVLEILEQAHYIH
jgi:hypothetical protein